MQDFYTKVFTLIAIKYFNIVISYKLHDTGARNLKLTKSTEWIRYFTPVATEDTAQKFYTKIDKMALAPFKDTRIIQPSEKSTEHNQKSLKSWTQQMKYFRTAPAKDKRIASAAFLNSKEKQISRLTVPSHPWVRHFKAIQMHDNTKEEKEKKRRRLFFISELKLSNDTLLNKVNETLSSSISKPIVSYNEFNTEKQLSIPNTQIEPVKYFEPLEQQLLTDFDQRIETSTNNNNNSTITMKSEFSNSTSIIVNSSSTKQTNLVKLSGKDVRHFEPINLVEPKMKYKFFNKHQENEKSPNPKNSNQVSMTTESYLKSKDELLPTMDNTWAMVRHFEPITEHVGTIMIDDDVTNNLINNITKEEKNKITTESAYLLQSQVPKDPDKPNKIFKAKVNKSDSQTFRTVKNPQYTPKLINQKQNLTAKENYLNRKLLLNQTSVLHRQETPGIDRKASNDKKDNKNHSSNLINAFAPRQNRHTKKSGKNGKSTLPNFIEKVNITQKSPFHHDPTTASIKYLQPELETTSIIQSKHENNILEKTSTTNTPHLELHKRFYEKIYYQVFHKHRPKASSTPAYRSVALYGGKNNKNIRPEEEITPYSVKLQIGQDPLDEASLPLQHTELEDDLKRLRKHSGSGHVPIRLSSVHLIRTNTSPYPIQWKKL